MSNLSQRYGSPRRPLIAGKPEITRAHVRNAVRELVKAARESGELPRGAVLVLGALLDADRWFSPVMLSCCPSQATLARSLGYCERAVRGFLKVLADGGWLYRSARSLQGGREADVYTFNFARVGFPELCVPPPVATRPKRRRKPPLRSPLTGRFLSSAAAHEAAKLAAVLSICPELAMGAASVVAQADARAARKALIEAENAAFLARLAGASSPRAQQSGALGEGTPLVDLFRGSGER